MKKACEKPGKDSCGDVCEEWEYCIDYNVCRIGKLLSYTNYNFCMQTVTVGTGFLGEVCATKRLRIMPGHTLARPANHTEVVTVRTMSSVI